MKFFFPDSHDYVDPSFDFVNETRSEHRIRQRDDVYPHEIFATPPYDGILVSKAVVDGVGGFTGKYSQPQRNRLLREGVRKFFRIDLYESCKSLETIGDCGAFTYIKEDRPPYTVDEVVDFYSFCRFDYGVSVDHVIGNFLRDSNRELPGIDGVPSEWKSRQEITLELASEFYKRCKTSGVPFKPIGVAQGWNPVSYSYAVDQLQNMGYDLIALGGLVPLRTEDILSILEGVQTTIQSTTRLHLFGVTRCEHAKTFIKSGVSSFDSTSPLRQAFKDLRNNYYAENGNYTAIRVPQVEGNIKLREKIRAGKIDQDHALELEGLALQLLIALDSGSGDLKSTLDALLNYESLLDGNKDNRAIYEKVLKEKPWKNCPCEICRTIGIHVMLFRGAQRNRRRGFHNLYVFYRDLKTKTGQ